MGAELFGLDLLSLGLVNSLNQDCLVLELVALGGQIELMVQCSVDLAGGSVLPQQSA